LIIFLRFLTFKIIKMELYLKLRQRSFRVFLIVSVILSGIFFTACNGPSDRGGKLEDGFSNPPASARPRVWWHWMNGNITKHGIREDLEWMHRVGIAGFQNFDASLNTPQIVEKRLVYMTPEWKDAFRFTAKLADSLGLEMAIAGSPGWSESGGPWVKPKQAMKKFVWSETRVEGGIPFKGVLPKPPSTTGPFQNLAGREAFSLSGSQDNAIPEYYADAAVVAYRLPDPDKSMADLHPKVTSSGGTFSLADLTDGDLATSTMLPYTKPGENAWIMFEFPQPQSIQGLSIVGGGFSGQFGFGGDQNRRTLEASDDGKVFKKVVDIPVRGIEEKTLDFNPVTARFFRFTWMTPAPRRESNIGAAFGFNSGSAPRGPAGVRIAELVLYPVARINHFEDKAAFVTATDLYSVPTPEIKPDEAVDTSDVIDLTSSMKSDGTLEWTPPDGRWVLIRLGYSLTGHRNSPASPEATGLEVDKLNASYVRDYFTNYLDQYKDATGGLMGKRGLQYIITDSWEAGTQNWTDDMMTEFAKRRGYDMLPWIPVLTGHIVESSEASDDFLWDFRKTLSDLVTENHYDQLTEILRERDMHRYSESHESGRAFIGDGMEVKSKAAIPMSATWTPGGLEPGTEVAPRYKADVRESASVAHIYGQNLVAAESMTAIGTAWAWSPETLKPTADMEMANGLNRFVIHTSVHQPVDDKIPGLGLGPFGQWFTRHETWAEEAGPWIDYLARSCYLLQQGKFVADIVYYYGEDNNITALFGGKLPDIPEGYNYDFVNADALVNALTMNDGLISTPGGTTYRLLALDANSRYMTLPVLKKIHDMAEAGALVVGDKPVGTPSLSDNTDEYNKIVNELWADEKGENVVGKGKIIAGRSMKDVLDALNVKPDFSYTESLDSTKLLFVHRQLGNTDIYWVNSRSPRVENMEAEFRVTGKAAEIWDPVTGKTEQTSFTIENGITRVPLHLEANDAVFIVFRKKTNQKSRIVDEPRENVLATVEGPWELSFQENRGAPPQALFQELTPWNENPDNGIKYFSGTVKYSNTIDVPADWLKEGSRICLDLGSVKNLAEVIVNGKSLGIVWKTPFRVDMTGSLKQGENNLEMKVTNLWVNRLIGDQQPGVEKKITYTTMDFYRADSPLKPSGLLGPVQILRLSD
jgi:hypothetical protein